MAPKPTTSERHAQSKDATEARGYRWKPKTATHEAMKARLGLDESLLVPLYPDGDPGTTRSLRSLAAHPPSRLRFSHAWQRDRELPHVWFEMLYAHLYVRVQDSVERHFKLADLPAAAARWDALWAQQPFSAQFVYYAELVARGDNRTGGWETLLTGATHRQYLVMGVIGKVLQTSVFDSLLFGAKPAQAELLATQDRATTEMEGFHRSYLRSENVRAMLGDDLLTPLFWDEVDKLSLQLVSLLLPMVKLLDTYLPQSRELSLRTLHQDLHHIVAEAGYLSIGMRWSRSVFRLRTPRPGETNDHTEQQHVDQEIYQLSREAANQEDTFEAWKLDRDEKKKAAAAAKKRGSGKNFPAAAAVRRYVPPGRIAKVLIVLWPSLQRYTAGGPLGPPAGEANSGSLQGMYETMLFKAAVVYYLGRLNDKDASDEARPTLSEHIWRAHWRRLFRRGPSWALLPAFRPYLIAVELVLLSVVGWKTSGWVRLEALSAAMVASILFLLFLNYLSGR